MALSSLPAGRQVAWSGLMLFYLYILENNDGRHYIGISTDIDKRLATHNAGKVRSTRPYRPWTIIHKEEYASRVEARRREVELKTSFSKRSPLFRK